MDRDVQNALIAEQKRVIHCMREYHDKNGDTEDAITVLVSTCKTPCLPAKVVVILIDGVINEQNIMHGDGPNGLVLSLSWIYSRYLKKLVSKEWNRCVGDNPWMKHWPKFAKVDNLDSSDTLKVSGPSELATRHLTISTEELVVSLEDGETFLIKAAHLEAKQKFKTFNFTNEVMSKILL